MSFFGLPLDAPEPSDDPLEAREQEMLDHLADSDTPLQVRVLDRQGVPVVAPMGEVDAYTVDAFRERVMEVVGRQPSAVVIDLSAASYLDSTGMAVLLQAARLLPQAIVVVSPRPRVTRLFEATGLARCVRVTRTLPEALGLCAQGGQGQP